jgi:hypothetical protein
MVLWEPSRPRTWLGGLGCTLALATLFLPHSIAQQAPGRYSEDDIVQALKADVPPNRIAVLARQHGISFPLTPETESRLRAAGATGQLLEALRPLAPPPTPTEAGPLLIKSNPAGAQVFLDGKLAGTTGPDGELQLPQLSPGEHKIRLTRAGYQDFEETASLLAGQHASIPVTLTSKPAVPEPPVAKFRVKLVGKCSGELIIGNARAQFRPDCDDSGAPFACPLSEITYGPTYRKSLFMQHGPLDGFYLRLSDNKNRNFRSDSTEAILRLLQQWGSRRP